MPATAGGAISNTAIGVIPFTTAPRFARHPPTALSPAPEASTTALIALGLASLAALQRRRREPLVTTS